MTSAGELDVDAYIAAAPAAAQPMLRQLRKVVKAAAPGAEEKMSYGMPFFEYHGRLVYFAGYKNHVGFYAALPATNTFAKELEPYLAAKSSIRFPIDQALPVALVTKLVKLRVKENEAK